MARPEGADTPLDAVVLAGGAARRMGGIDKPGLAVGGRTLLERVTDAVRAHNAAERPARGHGEDGARVVVVGPPRPSPRALYVREDPPGSGPVPALRTGLAHVRAPRFALLAADLPHLAPAHLAVLDAALEAGGTGAVFADSAGREQWLTGVWRTDAVRAALADYRGRSLYGLLGPLEPRTVRLADDLAVADCDTPDDLARARRLLDPPGG
ncbi:MULTISPECIES: molybdenum cofactor guanylyltransferase [unclassified Nocardiopsis]|uniref:molybdenum cofactor guanylyltransferase n=1 Tax=unclassified Nocardiopsis TaxID=2649073 RepID=UPI001358DC87|nr:MULTISPECIES: molybdenum cofactor guanylyltransferase [unclassified Nocardiopsis]